MRYTGEHKSQISFPLGGIGTGSVGLAGNGRFIDIEIHSMPNKGSEGGFMHFAIKAEDESRVLDARILNTDLQPDYTGSLERPDYNGYGWGPDRSSMAGFPHFREGEFEGKFPVAELDFQDKDFPGTVKMKAFNPFIPTNSDDSSIPGAFFEFEVTNSSDRELAYTLAFSGRNYYSQNHPEHTFCRIGANSYLHLSNRGDRESVEYGDVTIATDGEDVSYQQYWFRGNWFDSVGVYWKDFTQYGPLKNRVYGEKKPGMAYSNDDLGTLASRMKIPAGQRKRIRFVVTWSNPYMHNNWIITKLNLSAQQIEQIRSKKWKNYYATVFRDSLQSAQYSMENFSRLQEDTERFTELLYTSAVPEVVKDAVGANLSILKSTTCLRLEDGSFYGFEGTHPHMGCCEGTCTHVWSYAYALAYLFPDLERSARTLEYTQSMQEGGGMGFRLQLPVGSGPTNHRPAADGQFGTVLRVYREYLLSGDKNWLAQIWEKVKQSVAYAWSPENPDRWDFDKDGIMEGRQHHTLDMELFSENAWISGLYLAGLKAAAELARIMEDEQAEQEYTAVYESGVKKLNTELFNGEYFIQRIDLRDKSILERFHGGLSEYAEDAVSGYWNSEAQEMKYQIAGGCSIDQVLGQWHADLLGLGDIFEPEKVQSALRSIFQYNYIPEMYGHVNPCRLYALNDESGTVICSYPDKVYKPVIPVPYAEETMHGFEYQTASHMIRRGMEQEGLQCVKAVRDRYDGRRRNPWNEMECGSNYARSLASYALLLVYSGFSCNVAEKRIGFHPIHPDGAKFFWSLDTGFGYVEYGKKEITVKVCYGKLDIRRLDLDLSKTENVQWNGQDSAYRLERGSVILEQDICLHQGDTLAVRI